jgi:hypothetical protein
MCWAARRKEARKDSILFLPPIYGARNSSIKEVIS